MEGMIAKSSVAPMTLGAALEAFIHEHEYCGELDSGIDEHVVWMTCTCGARS
jgi:hypothetical protein